MLGNFLAFFIVIYFYPKQAFAYLDPGTGNAIIYLLVSLMGTTFFVLRGFAYKVIAVFKGKNTLEPKKENDLIIFSEGKIYWLTFKPIIEELIKQKKHFTYLSMDIEDPALTIRSPFMLSRYLGSGSAGFARINNYKAKLMLATTPNIGTKGYPMPRPKHIDCLAHVFHGIGDISYYNKNAFDSYDVLFLGGEFMLKSVRIIENKRNLKPKICVLAGFPYLDVLAESACTKLSSSNQPCVLVAPSWGEKSFLKYYGTEIISKLTKVGYKVIFRPHPYSFKAEKELLDEIISKIKDLPNLTIDNNIDAKYSMDIANVLISDKSGIRFDFAFIYERPVISIMLEKEHLDTYEASELPYIWEDCAANNIGIVVDSTKVDDVIAAVGNALNKGNRDIVSLKETTVSNMKTSSKVIVNWCLNYCKQVF